MTLSKDEIVKNDILLEAQKLFRQFGIKKTTMDEIAAACGKAKSTLYHYFKSKEEVFDAVIDMEMINLRRHVKDKVEEHKTMTDKIRTYIIEFHKEVVNKANLYRIVKHEYLNEARTKAYFTKLLEFEKSYIIRIMEDGVDSGDCKGIDRNDISWLAEILLASFYGTAQYLVEREGELDMAKLEKAAQLFTSKLFS